MSTEYKPKFLSWCKSYEEEEQEMRQMILSEPADLKQLKAEYLELTGKNFMISRYFSNCLLFINPPGFTDIDNSFLAGAKWMHEKIMSEASDGFEGWRKEYLKTLGGDSEYLGTILANMPETLMEEAWQAAKLSGAKEIEQLKQKLEIAVEALKDIQDFGENYADEGVDIWAICHDSLAKISAEKEQ